METMSDEDDKQQQLQEKTVCAYITIISWISLYNKPV